MATDYKVGQKIAQATMRSRYVYSKLWVGFMVGVFNGFTLGMREILFKVSRAVPV